MADFNSIRAELAYWDGYKFRKADQVEKDLKERATQVLYNNYGATTNVQEKTYYKDGKEIGSSIRILDDNSYNVHTVKKGSIEYSVNSLKKNPRFNKMTFNFNGTSVTIHDNDQAGKSGVVDSNDYVIFNEGQSRSVMSLGDFLSGHNPDMK